MKRFVFIGLVFLLVFSLGAPIFAWEFSMNGEIEWRYRYWTRTGNQDIFGTMSDAVNLGINHLQTFPTTATTNRGSGTFGVLAGENRFGSDMQLTDYRMTIFPVKANFMVARMVALNVHGLTKRLPKGYHLQIS
ncbi:MAG: hypothetical protein ACLP5H_21670 [Desulfomonilaceae bacterium]